MARPQQSLPALLLVLGAAAQGYAALAPHMLARSSGSTAAGKCSSEFLVNSVVSPQGTCVEGEHLVGMAVDLVYRCKGGVLKTEYFNASSGTHCKGTPFYMDELPLEACKSWKVRRGGSVIATCNSTSVTIRAFSQAPPTPQDVKCTAPGTVAARANSTAVDEVSFEVALPQGRPFLSYSAVADEHGVARASIPGLEAGRQYRVFARAHRRGQQEGDPDAWSNVSAKSVLCSGSGLDEPPATRSAAAVRTRWLEVFRLALGAAYPDFLDQHNVGDLVGEFTMGGGMALLPHTPLTRYCVELLDVMLPNISTASLSGGPEPSPFADYLSCVHGRCECMHQVDRSYARLPAKQIQEMCSGPAVPDAAVVNNTCRCSNVSAVLSSFYVGRSLLPLPFEVHSSLMRLPLKIPKGYPAASVGSPLGHFYSFPYAGRCAPGMEVGTSGCTWRRAPLAYTVFTDELREMGFNTSMDLRPAGSVAPDVEKIALDASLQNIELGRKAFAALGARPCGGQADRVIVV
mmetsp:Transcript_108117/g.349022  ORF Transcript_108117/g.349022 Transcript_108117/m.349022 type:complete len:517 (+) Transcript_108117:64-1614(+)